MTTLKQLLKTKETNSETNNVSQRTSLDEQVHQVRMPHLDRKKCI